MSQKEFIEHVESRTKPYKRLYCRSVLGVVAVHLVLALFVWNMPSVFTSKKKDPEAQVSQELANPAYQTVSQSEMSTAGKSEEKPTVAPGEIVDSELGQAPDVSSEKVVGGQQEMMADEATSNETIASPN